MLYAHLCDLCVGLHVQVLAPHGFLQVRGGCRAPPPLPLGYLKVQHSNEHTSDTEKDPRHDISTCFTHCFTGTRKIVFRFLCVSNTGATSILHLPHPWADSVNTATERSNTRRTPVQRPSLEPSSCEKHLKASESFLRVRPVVEIFVLGQAGLLACLEEPIMRKPRTRFSVRDAPRTIWDKKRQRKDSNETELEADSLYIQAERGNTTRNPLTFWSGDSCTAHSPPA